MAFWNSLAEGLRPMPKCPYCARPLRSGSITCRACRRYVLRPVHIVLLVLFGIIAVIGLLELAERLV